MEEKTYVQSVCKSRIVRFERQLSAGFTLIELLVVISIIALLMAIMMPALSKVRNSAQITVCGSNLKQIATGLNLYASDQGQYPTRNVGFPRLADRKVRGAASSNDMRQMVVKYIASEGSGLLHCPAVRSKKAETRPGIVETAVYSNHVDDEDRAKWARYFTIATFDPDTGASYGGEPAYMMTYNVFAGLGGDNDYSAGMSYDWKNSGNVQTNRSPKIQGSSKDVIAADMQERWNANGGLSRSNHAKTWESADAPGGKLVFVSANVACGDGHVELRKELKNWVQRKTSSLTSRFDY